MEKRDLELIKKHGENDQVLSNLYQEHLDYEKKVDELEEKSYLTSEEEFELRSLKKKKLLGRDQMELILDKYRSADNN